MEFEVAFEVAVYVECERQFHLETERIFHFEFEAEFDFDFDFGFDMECRSQAVDTFFLDLANTSEGRIWMPWRPCRPQPLAPGPGETTFNYYF